MTSNRLEDASNPNIEQEYGEVNLFLPSNNTINVKSLPLIKSETGDLKYTKIQSSRNDNYTFDRITYELEEEIKQNEVKIDLFSLENIDNFSCSSCKSLVKKNDTIRLPQYDSENPVKLVCGDCFYDSCRKRDEKRFEFMIISKDGRCVCKSRVCERALEAYKKVNTDLSETFKCYECHQKFLLKRALEVHIDIVHRNKSIFQCNECSKVFFTKQKIICHIQVYHLKMRKHSCRDCIKILSRSKIFSPCKQNANMHNGLLNKPNIESNEEVKLDDIVQSSDRQVYFEVPLENIVIYKCSLCNRLMEKNDAFRFLKYDNEPVKLVCSECYQCDYNRVNNNNFLCCECGKTFQLKNQLKSHIASQHNKLFQCQECFKVLSSKHTLDSHIDRIHWKK